MLVVLCQLPGQLGKVVSALSHAGQCTCVNGECLCQLATLLEMNGQKWFRFIFQEVAIPSETKAAGPPAEIRY